MVITQYFSAGIVFRLIYRVKIDPNNIRITTVGRSQDRYIKGQLWRDPNSEKTRGKG